MLIPCRLEELQEQRGGLVARAQVSGREKEALEGAKAAAEAYLGKEGELLGCRSTLLQLFLRDGQVPPHLAGMLVDRGT